MSAACGRDKFAACRVVGVTICFCGLSLRVYTCPALSALYAHFFAYALNLTLPLKKSLAATLLASLLKYQRPLRAVIVVVFVWLFVSCSITIFGGGYSAAFRIYLRR